MEERKEFLQRMKPFIAVIFLQFGLAGMDVICKAALNEGMSNYVLVVYRHAVATIVMAPFAIILDRKTRPKMTIPIFIKLMALSILEPVIDQNLYYLGMKHTTATFAAAMCNVLPAITFIMACILRLEKVKLRSIRSQAKVVGTLATVSGAMIMTLVKGPFIKLPWTEGRTKYQHGSVATNLHDSIKGSLMITVGCFSWSCFMILQAVTLETYPDELSLTVWICLLGTIEGSILALIMERGKPSVWAIHWDTKLLAATYSGVVCSGITYYVQGLIMKDRGPVFVTAFSPLSMVIVAVMGSFILAEQLFLGRVLGAIVIVAGLYLVVWGKNKDHKSSSRPTDEQLTLPADMKDIGGKVGKEFDHEVITIHATDEGESTKDEKVHEKNDSVKARMPDL